MNRVCIALTRLTRGATAVGDAGGFSLRILFYGRLADALGREMELDEVSGGTVGDLRQRIAAENPAAAQALSSQRVRACIGGSLMLDDDRVGATDAVEFLPPLSGG
jgi:molybdopterin converting factor small subunit